MDLYLFNEGSHFRLYRRLGAHPMRVADDVGTYFAVWAPNARRVSVIGDFNHWDQYRHVLRKRADAGIWEGFVRDVLPGSVYQFHIESTHAGYAVNKADPFAAYAQSPPKTGSIVWDLDYTWNDQRWMATRERRQTLDAPMSIYELHLGSWMRWPDEPDRRLTYRELAPLLVEHVHRCGFTHVELLPVGEHPFGGSWGYLCTAYFAPTSRFGTPQDFMFLIDTLHQADIGVILDWVPSHFPGDEHGLVFFDGTHLYEHPDPRRGHHPDWDSAIFDYGRREVGSFLISSAFNWLDRYHADALRVDAVASMLRLDYSRKPGEWVPNDFGGHENLEAVEFVRRLNESVYDSFPDVQTIAEESTSWPMVSKSLSLGGLGFGMKWDLGWMHDTLSYLSHDPIHRRSHHNELTFRMTYAFDENFVNALSHDEVVYGKGSLLSRMPGDEWQRFANLRLLLGYMFAQTGKKLLFMGGEFGQWEEWDHQRGLDWHLLDEPRHAATMLWVRDLNRTYAAEPALHRRDCRSDGFQWIDCNDSEQSTISLMRVGESGDPPVVAVFNFTPVPRHEHPLGVPQGGRWQEILNSDAREYSGSGVGNCGAVDAKPSPMHGRPYSLHVELPPLGAVFFRGPRDSAAVGDAP
jgi:1,4-alpha-glucan branching enzyme